jgi:hypothetical protein
MSFAADSGEPDQPQAVKAGAVAPPLRGFDLDGLRLPRSGLSKQTKANWGAQFSTRTAIPTSTMCLPRALDRKAVESRVLTGLRERMITSEIATDAKRAYR